MFFLTELGGVQKIDQVFLEVADVGPLSLVPGFEGEDGAGAGLALDELAVFLTWDFFVAVARVFTEPGNGLGLRLITKKGAATSRTRRPDRP